MKNKHFRFKPKLKIKFNESEKTSLEEFFKKTKDLKAKMRANGVLLRTKGYRLIEIADILGKTETTIRNWTRAFKKQGIKGLIPKIQRGNHRILTRKQKEEIKTIIKIKKPFQLNLNAKAKFWNVPLLKNFVKNYFSLEYRSDKSYQRLFSYCGFSFHKPIGKDKRQSPKQVKKFQLELKDKIRKIDEEEKRGCKIGSSWLPMKPD